MSNKKKKCEECRKEETKDSLSVCNGCYKHDRIVMNALLSYVATYSHRSTQGQLKVVLLGYYSEDEINNAKEVIISHAKKMDIDIKDMDVKRQGSSTRSASEAEIDDILNIYTKVTSGSPKKVSRFCCEDIARLPPVAPEATGSLVTLYEILAKQQRQLIEMETNLVSLRSDVLKNTEKLTVGSTYADVVRLNESPASSCIPNDTNATTTRVAPSTSRVVTGLPRIEHATLNAALQQISASDSNFQTVHSNGKRPFKGTERLVSRPKKQPQKGAAVEAGSLMSGPELFHVQLTNVSPKITEERITEYIKEKDATLSINEVTDTSSEGWETKRFLLSFNMEFYEIIMNDQFWPKGIYYKQWYKIKPRTKNKPGEL